MRQRSKYPARGSTAKRQQLDKAGERYDRGRSRGDPPLYATDFASQSLNFTIQSSYLTIQSGYLTIQSGYLGVQSSHIGLNFSPHLLKVGLRGQMLVAAFNAAHAFAE